MDIKSVISTDVISNIYLSNAQELPEFRFKPGLMDIGSAIRTLTDAISLRVPMSNIIDKDQLVQLTNIVGPQVFSDYFKLRNDPEYECCFTPINELSSNIAEAVINVFNVLKNTVKPEVDSLKEAILEKYSELDRDILNSTSAGLELNDETIRIPFSLVVWDDLIAPLGGYSGISTFFNASTGVDFSGTSSDLHTLLQSFPTFPELKFDEMTLADISRRWREGVEAPDGIHEALFDLMFNNAEASMFVGNITILQNRRDITESLNIIEHYLIDYYNVFTQLKSIPLNVTDEMSANIHTKFEILNAVFYAYGIFMIILRNYYKDSFIMSDSKLNGDLQDEFESKGGNLDILNKFVYINYVRPKLDIPYSGINIDAIMSQKENTEKTFNEIKNRAQLNAAVDKQILMVRAAREVLSEHISNVSPTRLPANMSEKYFIDSTISTLSKYLNYIDSSSDNHLDSMLYDFIINTWYRGTMVETAHKLFGSKVITQIEASPEIDESAMALIDVRVASSLAASFVFKELCE